LTTSYTSHVGLIFHAQKTLAIHAADPDQLREISEPHIPLILEIFVHQHRLEDAYQAYCRLREQSATQHPALVATLRQALAAAGGKLAVLLVRDKVYACPPESMFEAYMLATSQSSQPPSEATLAAFRIHSLTALSANAPHVVAILQDHFGSAAGGYPELTFEQFRALVERLIAEALLIVPVGRIDFGDFRGRLPFCPQFGSFRGTPIDRYYLDKFILEIREKVTGKTLEVGGKRENHQLYDFRKASPYLTMDLEGKGLDIVADAHDTNAVAENSLDSIVIFNVLEHCERPWVVVGNIHRWLKDGGQVFCMVPNAQRVHRLPKDFWRILPDAMDSLFSGFAQRQLYVYGNPLTVVAAHVGISAEELTTAELDDFHESYPIATCIHAHK
jgi:SAM-dependent methyltransferase